MEKGRGGGIECPVYGMISTSKDIEEKLNCEKLSCHFVQNDNISKFRSGF